MKNGYTARNNHHVIVRNLSQFMLWSCFFLIATDGDFTTSLINYRYASPGATEE